VINGPAGTGSGQLRGLQVLQQPGPPMGLSWAISTLPLIALVVLIVLAWRRTRSRLRGGGLPATAGDVGHIRRAKGTSRCRTASFTACAGRRPSPCSGAG